MLSRFTKLITVLTVSAGSSLLCSGAIASPVPVEYPDTFESIPEAFDRVYYNESGTSFDSTRITNQLNSIFGWGSFPEGSFPENAMTRESERIHQLYVEQMKRQSMQDPILRTRDLDNPFDGSIRQNPLRYLPERP